eukprot:1394135-Amorphochlora_amoeboformis.AAC.1
MYITSCRVPGDPTPEGWVKVRVMVGIKRSLEIARDIPEIAGDPFIEYYPVLPLPHGSNEAPNYYGTACGVTLSEEPRNSKIFCAHMQIRNPNGLQSASALRVYYTA